jgi:hypothetical protein
MEVLTPDSLRGVIAGFSKPLHEQKQGSAAADL